MKKFEYLDHPADIHIRSYGKNLEELFINSALGMMDFLYGSNLGQEIKGSEEKIQIKSKNLESLLVDWLSEILWLSNTNYHAYTKYKIEKLTKNEIMAKAFPRQGQAKEDIKAVTYHNLSIKKTDAGYTADVVYDI